MRLNLGCGNNLKKEYLNIDADSSFDPASHIPFLCSDVRDLVFEDESIEEIIACHIIEHLTTMEMRKCLSDWYRWLVTGGVLYLGIPDWETMARFIEGGKATNTVFDVMFGAMDGIMSHQWLMSKESMVSELESIGFKVDGTFSGQGGSSDFTVDRIPISLNLRCIK